MISLQGIYKYSPVYIQQLMLSAKSYLNQRYRRRKLHDHFVEQFMKLQWADHQELEDFQRNRFTEVFKEVASNVPYYQKMFHDYNFDPQSYCNIDDIKRLPVVQKSMLRDRAVEFSNPLRKSIYIARTGGTTGAPLVSPYDDESMQLSIAIQDHYFQSVGIQIGKPCLYLCGQPIVPHSETRRFCRVDYATNSIFASVHHLSSKTFDRYLKEITAFNPVWGMGYTSFAFELARYIIERGEIGRIRLAGFMGTSETATPEMRHVIEKGFCTRLFDYYSSTEGIPFIGQCVAGNYHLHPASGFVEFVDSQGKTVPAGKPGEMVVTSFKQLKRPLLRYAVKDTGVLSIKQNCPCGLKWTVVEKLYGRMAEWVTNKEGKRISQFSHQIFKIIDHVQASQIEQFKPDSFTVKLVVNPEFRIDVEKAVRRRFLEILGHDASLIFDFVSDIPRTQGGKCPTVISHV